MVFRRLATSPEEHLLGDTNKPVQVFLVKWIPPAHPTPQACPSGWGGGGFWILIQFLLRAITVSLQATQAAGYVCTENSAVGGETKGKETGGGGRFYAPKSHGASDRQKDSTASESGLPEAGEGELIPQSPVRPEAAGSFGQKALGSSRLSVPVGRPRGIPGKYFYVSDRTGSAYLLFP